MAKSKKLCSLPCPSVCRPSQIIISHWIHKHVARIRIACSRASRSHPGRFSEAGSLLVVVLQCERFRYVEENMTGITIIIVLCLTCLLRIASTTPGGVNVNIDSAVSFSDSGVPHFEPIHQQVFHLISCPTYTRANRLQDRQVTAACAIEGLPRGMRPGDFQVGSHHSIGEVSRNRENIKRVCIS